MKFRLVLLCIMGILQLGLSSASAQAATILVYGDSLSAAYGIPREQGWVALLESRLTSQNQPHQVINASISGETTAGGWSRFPAALNQHKPDIVILELGANDGLRGLPIAQMRSNLLNMIRASKKSGARVLLLGMMIPPNYGPKYAREFSLSFTEIAQEQQLPLVAFFLDGVTGQAEFTQDDGLHPKANAQGKILDNVWKGLSPMLKGGTGKSGKVN